MSKRALLVVMGLLGVACQRETPNVEAHLRVALPQTSTIDFIGVSGTQGDEVVTPVSSDALSATFTVEAGVPLTLDAVLFDLEVAELVGYEGSHTFTPEPGEQSVQIDVALLEGNDLPATAVFDDGREFLGNLVVTLRDQATGFEVPSAFHLGEAFTLPVGRTFELVATNPTDGAEAVTAVTITSTEAPVLDLGAGPELPGGVVATAGSGITTVDLVANPSFDVQCAYVLTEDCIELGSFCPDLDPTDWHSCDSQLSLLDLLTGAHARLEGCYVLAVRYSEVSDSCGLVPAHYDFTPPVVKLQVNPSRIFATDPQQVTVTGFSDEPLLESSITVRQTSSTTGTSTSCDTLELASDRMSFTCTPLQWTGAGPDTRIIEVKGTDLAGNAFNVTKPISDFTGATVTTGAWLEVLSAEPHPTVPNPTSPRIPVLLEIMNVGDAAACSPYIDSVGATSEGGNSTLDGYAAPFPEATVLPGATHKVWTMLDSGGEGRFYPFENGIYELFASVAWLDCVSAVQQVNPFRLDLVFQRPPLRWLTNAPLHLPALMGLTTIDSFGTPFVAEVRPPFIPPVRGGSLLSYSQSTGMSITAEDADVLTVEEMALRPSAPGETIITIEEPPGTPQDSVRLVLEPGPTLLALSGSYLHRMDPLGRTSTRTALDTATLGAPKRVLWDPTRNQAIVVGTNGVQAVDTALPAFVPCGADSIIDAELTAAGPGHRRNAHDLALLVSRGGALVHCEIDLYTLGTAMEGNVPGGCAATELLVHPISGEHTVLGTSGVQTCAVSYHTRSGEVSFLRSSPQGLSVGTIRKAELDPWGNVATVIAADGTQLTYAFGWRLGQGLGALNVYTDAYGVAGAPDDDYPVATVMDVVDGKPLVVTHRRFGGTGIPERRELVTYDSASGITPSPIRDGYNASQVDTPLPLTTSAVLDASRQHLYLGDDEGRVMIIASNWAYFTFNASATTLDTNTGAPVVDMAIAGPEPVRITQPRSAAGQVRTVLGRGFAPTGNRVFVQGIEAPLVSESSTAITFIMPLELRDLDRTWDSTWVTVMTHGIMSGPAGGDTSVPEIPIGFSLASGGSQQPNYCLGTCTRVTLLPSPLFDQFYSTDMAVGAYSPFMSFPLEISDGAGPVSAVGLNGNRRMLGPVGGAWQELRLNMTYLNVTEDPATYGSITDGLVAANAREDVVALVVGDDVEFFWASSLDPHPWGSVTNLFGGTGSVRTAVFMNDHDSLIALSDSGELVAVNLAASEPAVIPAVFDGAACPFAPTDTPLALSSAGSDNRATAVYHGNGEFTVWTLGYEGSSLVSRCIGVGPKLTLDPGVSPVVSIYPDGRFVAIATTHTEVGKVQIVRRDAPHIIALEIGGTAFPFDMTFSPDGQWLYMADLSTLYSFDLFPAPVSGFQP